MVTTDPPGPLADWTLLPSGDWPWPVFRRGTTGPPVVVIHELCGVTPPLIRFADRLVAGRFTVYLPVLGGPAPAESKGERRRAAAHVCLLLRVDAFRDRAPRRVVDPLRRLTAYAAKQARTGRAGVVGMCFSGGFALALAADEPVSAGVAAQPSLPFAPLWPPCAGRLGLSADDERRLRDRLDDGRTALYVTRFSADKVSPAKRADAIRARLGVEVDEVRSEPGNPYGFDAKEHSVLAIAPARGKYQEGPAADRLQETYDGVVAFLNGRLRPTG